MLARKTNSKVFHEVAATILNMPDVDPGEYVRTRCGIAIKVWEIDEEGQDPTCKRCRKVVAAELTTMLRMGLPYREPYKP